VAGSGIIEEMGKRNRLKENRIHKNASKKAFYLECKDRTIKKALS
jgi:hypothetical protein